MVQHASFGGKIRQLRLRILPQQDAWRTQNSAGFLPSTWLTFSVRETRCLCVPLANIHVKDPYNRSSGVSCNHAAVAIRQQNRHFNVYLHMPFRSKINLRITYFHEPCCSYQLCPPQHTFWVVLDPTNDPMLARESTAATTPSLNISATVVVP